ncbi:hypothetical protein [Roseofilum casamattae]|uniref:DUF4184 family protein n=1 Tax=Roseofilum casamattae BLCC-M143 TaxID=3022442 RepID=A0ABT7BU36_9CYAN|nr:hypothetical protein [Roseofilum casamattae]MDJ1182702.1 hypothetical protein [Roseofilum casamattae BLCC-M143]
MNTPSHAILNLALLGKAKFPQYNLLIAFGGIAPDIPIFLFYGWAKLIAKLPESQIWSEAYYEPGWQTFIALSHSIPLATIILILAYWIDWQWLQLFCLSLICHSLLDLPVHHDDAHRHFFPFSNYRFNSPFSYWDVNHYGVWVSLVEMLLVIAATYYYWGNITSWFGKGTMLFVNIAYVVLWFLFYFRYWIQA